MLGLTSQHLAASAVRQSASLMVSNDEAASRCARSDGSHLPCAMNVLASISLWPMSIMRAAKYRGPPWRWRSHCAAASLSLNGVSLRFTLQVPRLSFAARPLWRASAFLGFWVQRLLDQRRLGTA